MRTYPLRYPGVFLEIPDRTASHELTRLLHHLEDALIDAAIALDLFEFGTGRAMPREYASRAQFAYAHAFLLAVDSAGKVLQVIADKPGLPAPVESMHDKFSDTFPTVVGLRDTTQHVEDRGRGLGKGGKPLQLQPVDNQVLRAPGGALVIDALNGSVFGSTMADGHYGEIDVSNATLTNLQTLLQELLDALPWSGDSRESPRPPRTAPEIPEWVRKHLEAQEKRP